MKTRTLLLGSVAAAALLLTGCTPTKTGMDARNNARSRLDGYNSSFTLAQAKQEFESGQFDLALKDIDRSIAQSPADAEAYLLKGRIHLERNELELAARAFMQASEIDETFPGPHYFCGIVYQRWSDDEEAFNQYRKAYELDPNKETYLLATAESLIALGELDEAQTLVESKLDHFEHDPAMHQLLGQIALLENEPLIAAKYYREARMLDPDNVYLLEELVWVQYEAKQFSDCYASLQQLLPQLDESRPDLAHLEARCLSMMGRTADAHNAYMILARENAGNIAIWIELGTLAWKLDDKRRLAESGMRVIALAPDRFEGYMLKGLNERNSGRYDHAAVLFKQAVDRAKGTTVMPHVLLGQSLEKTGDFKGAAQAYQAAIRIDPTSQEARSMMAALQAQFASVPSN